MLIVTKVLVLLLYLFASSNFISAQENPSEIFGWQGFTLPGLPDEEVTILTTMLNSGNPNLVSQALLEIKQGVSNGRISPQTPEYQEFVYSLLEQTGERTRTGSSPRYNQDPRNHQILVDLIVPLSLEEGTKNFSLLFQNTSDIAVLEYAIQQNVLFNKPIHGPFTPAIVRHLRSQTTGVHQVDERFVRTLLWSIETRFLSHGDIPEKDLVLGILGLYDRINNTVLKNRIIEVLELLFQI